LRERCQHLLVDEAQDLDRAQLRLALLLAAPANRIFLVGNDDQPSFRTRTYSGLSERGGRRPERAVPWDIEVGRSRGLPLR
jgi:hypothetical protein